MDTEFIPKEITENPNFNCDDKERIKYINDTFREILSIDKSIKGSKDYKDLIKEINGRFDAEMLVKIKREHSIKVEEQLKKAKEELQNLKDMINNNK